MKKILLSFVLFVSCVTIFACFMDNPVKFFKTYTIPVTMPYVSKTGVALTQQPVATVDLVTVPTSVKSMNNQYVSAQVKLVGGVSYRYKVTISQSSEVIKRTTETTNLTTNQVTSKVETFNADANGIWNNKIYPIDTRQPMPMTINAQFSGFGDDEIITRACLLYLNRNGKWVIIVDLKNPKQNLVSNSGESKASFGKNCIKQTYGYKPGQILYVLTYYESKNFATHNLNNLLIKKVTNPSEIDGIIAIGIIENERPQ